MNIIKCIICKDDIEHKMHPTTGEVYWTEGNNAQPVADGRCCDSCDCRVVIPTRLGMNPHSQQALGLGEMFLRTRLNPPIFDEPAEKRAEEAQQSREYGHTHPTVDDYDESLDDPNYECDEQ